MWGLSVRNTKPGIHNLRKVRIEKSRETTPLPCSEPNDEQLYPSNVVFASIAGSLVSLTQQVPDDQNRWAGDMDHRTHG